jgi:hypothetical protein
MEVFILPQDEFVVVRKSTPDPGLGVSPRRREETGEVHTTDKDVEIERLLELNGDLNAAVRYQWCGEPGAGWFAHCEKCGENSHFIDFRCELRICRSCARKRANVFRHKMLEIVKSKGLKAGQAYRFKRFDLTTNINLRDYIEVGEDGKLNQVKLQELASRIEYVNDGAVKMFEAKFGSGRDYKNGVRWGAAIGTEFGEHLYLHLHVFAFCPYYPKFELSEDWAKLGVGFITWVVEVSEEEGIAYVAKYVSKLFKEDVEVTALDLVAMHFVMKGRRWFRTIGVLYGSFKKERMVCEKCGFGYLVWHSERRILDLLITNKCYKVDGQPMPFQYELELSP